MPQTSLPGLGKQVDHEKSDEISAGELFLSGRPPFRNAMREGLVYFIRLDGKKLCFGIIHGRVFSQ
jgi:hypothetical protein